MTKERNPLLTKEGFEKHIADLWWKANLHEMGIKRSKSDNAPWIPKTAKSRKAYWRDLNIVEGEMIGPKIQLLEFMIQLDNYIKRHKVTSAKKKGKKNV